MIYLLCLAAVPVLFFAFIGIITTVKLLQLGRKLREQAKRQRDTLD